MLPVYRCTDSYSHQRNQMPFTQYYHPGLEAIPPQMRVDPAKFLVSYESWPYGGNSGYPTPSQACCNHGYFPGYYSCRPPYPHLSPPLPFHCHGSYPPFPEAYPVQYVPPPHSSMEQPRYEHDKNVPGNYHCCGCPNHMGNWREGNNLKIEEQEPDTEKRGINSLAPVELKNYPYPIVWIPPEYLKNKDHRKPFESKVKDGDEVSCETKPPESSKSLEPSMWNGWFPLDMNSLKSLKQGGDGKKTRNQQEGDKMGQFPLPIIWMPSHDKPEEVEMKSHKESKAAPKSAEEPPSVFEVVPLKLPGCDDSMKKPSESEENFGDVVGPNMMEKNANKKSIPVKQMEPQGEMKTTLEDSQGKTRGVPVKHGEGNGLNNPTESSAKRQSSSPPKMSKLPPVCLRVDPLPRRKNGDGSSRFSSPSGHKGNSQEKLNEKSKASASASLKGNDQQDSKALNSATSKSKEVEPNKERKVIEVTERTGSQNTDRDLKKGSHTDIQSQTQVPVNLPINSHEAVSKTTTTMEKAGTDAGKCNVEEGKGERDVEDMAFEEATEAKKAAENVQSDDGECKIEEDKRVSEANEGKSEDVLKVSKRKLSDAEAAVIIQSAYRGFEVRKWEPLKKLKHIAKVREQVVEVRSRIHTLESSSDLRRDDKQRVMIGETIMSLLLKLDTIQGLHPSLRDIRKSVARELTNLLEKVDSLAIQKSEDLLEEVPTTKLVEGRVDTQKDVCMQGQDKEAEEVGSGDNYSESNHDNSYVLMEPHQGQPPHATDAISGSQGEETSGPFLVDGVQEECENKNASGEVPKAAESEPITEPKDELADKKLDGSQEVIMEIQKENCEPCSSNSEVERSVELPSVAQEKTSEMESTESLSEDISAGEGKSEVAAEVAEPKCDDSTSVPESEKHGQIEGQKEDILQDGEFEQTKREEIEALHGGEVEYYLRVGAISPNDDASDVYQLEQQPREANEEGPLTTELEDSVKVHEEGPIAAALEDSVKANTQNDEDVIDDLKLKLEAVQPQGEDVSHDNELAEVSETEEAQPTFSIAEKESRDKEQEGHGISNGDQTSPSGPTKAMVASQEEVPIEEVFTSHVEEMLIEETKGDDVAQPLIIGVKEGELVEEKDKFNELESEKVESNELESKTGNDMSLGQPNESRTTKDEALAGTQFVPAGAERGEEEEEIFPVSPTVSAEENVMESDKKLIEENYKLRELMEKLIEAGKEQLRVISDLSERVKDLERKLSRKKKLRTRRYRGAISASNHRMIP